MRLKITLLALVLGLFAAAAVVATAQTTNGLPQYTKNYKKWPKLNKKVIKGGSPAHQGVKNVFSSKKQNLKTKKFPNGTVIVKSIAEPGRKGLPAMVAIMRKVKGKWRWGEYSLSGKRYSRLAIPNSVCTGCHVGAKKKDWVFTAK
jgi:hypothetical protein